MKVVVAIPIYRAAEFFRDTATYLYKLEPQPDKYLFCENNSTDATISYLKQYNRPKEILRLWFQDHALDKLDTPFDLIAIVRQMLLTRLRQLDPDFAIFLDSDILPLQSDLIKRLTRHCRDIVGGPYLRPYPQGMYLAALWKGAPFKLRYFPPKKFGPVMAVGGGCMCLSRQVIQDKSLNFYPIEIPESSEDYGYCLKATERGYKVYLDSSIRLKHWVTQEHVNGKSWRVDERGRPLPFKYGV